MYTLVLAIFLAAGQGGYVSDTVVTASFSHVVPGFTTEQECKKAGQRLAEKITKDVWGIPPKMSERIERIKGGSKSSISCIKM